MQEIVKPKSVKERSNEDLLELTLQLHSRSLRAGTKKMHDAYVDARNELEQRLEAGQNETLVIFDTPEKAEEGALLLARIRQISRDQLSSEQVKRMNELIKATGFELHWRK